MRTLLLAAALAISTAAHAADAPTVPPPAAAEEKPSPAKLAAAMDLLDATNAMGNVNQMIGAMWNAEAGEIKRAHPDVDETKLAAIEKIIQDAFAARAGEYKQLIATVYALHLSEDDMRALAVFYRSDVGKRYTAAMPEMIKDMSVVGVSWARRLMEELRPKIMEQMGAKKEQPA